MQIFPLIAMQTDHRNINEGICLLIHILFVGNEKEQKNIWLMTELALCMVMG